jgi:preprotein translocase subunit SecD
MNKNSLWIRTGIILAITLIGAYLVFGPRNSFTLQDFSWQGIKNNLSNNINLGLDLRGGTRLVMRVQTDKYLSELTLNNKNAAQLAAQEANLPVGEASHVAQGNTYSITLPVNDPAQIDRVVEEVNKKVDFVNFWQQSTSGNAITWNLSTRDQSTLSQQAVEQAKRIIDGRINAFGVKEPTLQEGAAGSNQIFLQMPGVEDPERVKVLIGGRAKLEMVKVVSPPYPSGLQTYPTREAALASIGGKESDTRRVLPYAEREDFPTGQQPAQQPPTQWVVVEYPAIVDGSELRDASAFSQTQNLTDYQINFSFKPAGAQRFGEWTGKNINNYMAVVLDDGVRAEVKSAAYIRSQIFDQGQIDGRFTKESAEDLVLTLKSGALPAPIEYLEERTVGPSLGADSIRAGVTASVGGLLFVMVFMLFYYRGAGINAVVALVLNMLLVMAALVMFGSTLTLPGIAGLILGIGMAIDANVLIFERIREELRAGKNVAESVPIGFDKAFVTIVDANVTTIISAIILYLYGSSTIRGFAVTLILGLLINLFTAVFVSRTIFNWLLLRNPKTQKLSI